MNYTKIHQISDELPSYPVPKALFSGKYINMSNNTRMAYTFIKDKGNSAKENNWHDKNSNVFVIYPNEELAKNMGASERSVNDYIKELISLGLIRKGLDATIKYELVSSKKLKGQGIGNQVCEWCGINTLITHQHHFPIQRKDGGTETVNICPNCHQEFHSLDSAIVILK